MPFLIFLLPDGILFLPLAKVIPKKCGFLTEKTYFFEAKNVIFLRLLSQGAKIKPQKAAVFLQRAEIYRVFIGFENILVSGRTEKKF